MGFVVSIDAGIVPKFGEPIGAKVTGDRALFDEDVEFGVAVESGGGEVAGADDAVVVEEVGFGVEKWGFGIHCAVESGLDVIVLEVGDEPIDLLFVLMIELLVFELFLDAATEMSDEVDAIVFGGEDGWVTTDEQI